MAEAGNNSESDRGEIASRFTLKTSNRLSQFDTAGGIAYEATDSKNLDMAVYGLVQDPLIPQREGPLKILLKKEMKHYANCIGQGVMDVPDASGQVKRLVTIFQRPMGPSLASPQGRERINERFLLGGFMRGMVIALAELHAREITHRAIRPSNIFFADQSGTDIVLGECVSAPPGMGQAPGCETIRRCDCLPYARGDGAAVDDFFSLGATIMSMVLGRSVGEGANLDIILADKIDKGSFRHLAGNSSVPDYASEILHGLLVDDGEARWGLEQLAQIMDGRIPKVSTGADAWVLSKPVGFAGNSYSDRRTLAQGFGAKPKEAVQHLKQDAVAKWVTEYMTAEVFSEKVEAVLNVDGREAHPRPEMAKAARFCAYLDPMGPVRYNGFTIAMDGFGPFVASCFWQDGAKRMEAAKELLGTDLMESIIKLKVERNPKVAKDIGQFTWAHSMLRSSRRGQGMERILYEYNSRMPCLSPNFKGKWVRSARAVIRGLDNQIGTSGKTTGLFDEHVCGFCAAQVSGLDKVFAQLTSSDLPKGGAVGKMVDALGAIQSRAKTGPLPNLCEKLCENMYSIIRDMHYKPRREMLEKMLDGLAKSGMLSQVSSQLKLSAHKAKDDQEFQQASRVFAHLDRERSKLKLEISPEDPRAINNGYQAASTIGLLLMIVSVFIAAVGM